MRIALVKNGFVVNVVESVLGAHAGYVEVASDSANIGDTYDGSTFTAPYVPPLQPSNDPPAIPQSVTAFQAKVALDYFGLLPSVELLMQDANTPNKIKLAWSNGAIFKRYSNMIIGMAAILNIDDAQLDALFEYAATVE